MAHVLDEVLASFFMNGVRPFGSATAREKEMENSWLSTKECYFLIKSMKQAFADLEAEDLQGMQTKNAAQKSGREWEAIAGRLEDGGIIHLLIFLSECLPSAGMTHVELPLRFRIRWSL